MVHMGIGPAPFDNKATILGTRLWRDIISWRVAL